ncbi:ABC-2 family transporter protein [Candidatus Woesebacteria bacterium]|nr:ABC-2 family transporter protein [Candidatus Woesebacteria bacterium]
MDKKSLNITIPDFFQKLDLSRLSVLLKRSTSKFAQKIKYFIFNFSFIVARFRYYFELWMKMTRNSFMVLLAQKRLFFLFLIGKLLRFILFGVFLIFLVKGSGSLAGYSVNESIFFFLTYNLIDVISQFLYREVYRFRPLVVSGDLDLIMTKPYSTLFRVLLGGVDLIDFVTILPLVVLLIYFGSMLDPTFIELVYFLILTLNGLVIATAFHIAVLSLGIITYETDHVIWIYRDLTSLGRLPVDIYKQPLRAIITYLIPVGLMMSFPVRSLLGLMPFWGVAGSLVFGSLLIILSIKFWNFSVLRYRSAGS